MARFGRALNEVELAAYDIIPTALARQVLIVNIPFMPGRFEAITLGTIIATTRELPDDGTSELLAHELVHVGQWEDDGKVRFALDYVSQFAKGFASLRSWNQAYLRIGAEVEAREHAADWCDRCANPDQRL